MTELAGASTEAAFTKKPQAVALLASFSATALVGLAATHVLGSSQAGLVSAAAFAAVVSAAMLISWGAEAAQFFFSQGLAVALIALLQVMPEFMVEAVIAWKGEIRNMFANATGSNRLLIGLGWPLIYFTADISSRLRHGHGAGDVKLRRENILEVLSLLAASSYYLKFLVLGSLTIFDGIFLVTMYVMYMLLLAKLPEEEEESKEDLLAPPRLIVEVPKKMGRTILGGLFVIGAAVMILVAEPFVQSLKQVAGAWGISQFAFIQWVAPFLSEFPEKVTAFYWSRTIRLAPMAMLNMISSTVSQFTLLVGMIPIVYAVARFTGHVPNGATGFFGLPIVPMENLRPEVFLSWAMTLYGCSLLAKLRFGFWDASSMLAIWILQFCSGPVGRLTGIHEEKQRTYLGVICIALAVGQVIKNWKHICIREALTETRALIRHGRAPA